ncbi:MAG: carboxylate-amine ligase [Chloroflexi bacterium]|nr:carboxylate-amine ligase [Chloroflexota bacterium]
MSDLPPLTIGIEEEYQIVDPKTGELKSSICRLLETGKLILREQLQPELHQSQVEIGTKVCETPAEAREELVRLRQAVMALAARDGLKIAAAGTHPFSSWSDQEVTPFDRYLGIAEDMQLVAQRLLTFGTHVHIGIEDPELRIAVMNAARAMLPQLLCLTTSSPFWIGQTTGFKSYRGIVFGDLPRHGIPPTFGSEAEFQGLVDTLVKTNCIPDGSKIYWDVRPHFKFPTLEFRICDVTTRVDEAACVAAIFQALVAKLAKLRSAGQSPPSYPSILIEENKWRAMRYGLDGNLIDLATERERPARELIGELIEDFLADAIDELGTRSEIAYAYRIMDEGTSADRQLATYQRTGDLHAVVAQLIQETEEGVL